MADLAALPYDSIVSILKKVKFIEDVVVFGSVCKSWKEIVINNKKCLHRQIPWLLMPEKAGDGRQQIYSLSKAKVLTNNLYIPEKANKWSSIGLNYGWLLTACLDSGALNLVHPISRSVIRLPPWTRHGHIFNKRGAALSADPSESSDFVLMNVQCSYSRRRLSYWKSGETQWTIVENEEQAFNDVIYYQDQFYGINTLGEFWGFKFSAGRHHNDTPSRRLVAKIASEFSYLHNFYVVGSEGRLLVVDRRYVEMIFHVHKLDLISGSYKRITSLGNSAIFVGNNTSISLDHVSEYQILKSNHIYFSDDLRPWVPPMGVRRLDMGCCNLEDGRITKFTLEYESSTCPVCPPFWFIPSL